MAGPPIIDLSGFAPTFVSNTFDISFTCLLTTTCPLSSDPLTDIARTVSEFGSIGFAEGKELHSFASDEKDVIEIDGYSAFFPSEQVSKRVHMLRFNPATYAQNHTFFFTDESFDSAAHRVPLGSSHSYLRCFLHCVTQQPPALQRRLPRGRISGRMSPGCGSRRYNRDDGSGRWLSDWTAVERAGARWRASGGGRHI